MLLLLKIAAVIVLIICLGFIAYWAVAVIKGDCVLRMLKSKRTPLHVESMDRKHVTLSFTIPIKNVGKQLGTIMDAFVRIYLPFEQYDNARVTGHLTDFDVPRDDDYWQAFILDPGKEKKFLITLDIDGKGQSILQDLKPSRNSAWTSFTRWWQEATTTTQKQESSLPGKSCRMRSMNILRR